MACTGVQTGTQRDIRLRIEVTQTKVSALSLVTPIMSPVEPQSQASWPSTNVYYDNRLRIWALT